MTALGFCWRSLDICWEFQRRCVCSIGPSFNYNLLTLATFTAPQARHCQLLLGSDREPACKLLDCMALQHATVRTSPRLPWHCSYVALPSCEISVFRARWCQLQRIRTRRKPRLPQRWLYDAISECRCHSSVASVIGRLAELLCRSAMRRRLYGCRFQCLDLSRRCSLSSVTQRFVCFSSLLSFQSVDRKEILTTWNRRGSMATTLR